MDNSRDEQEQPQLLPARAYQQSTGSGIAQLWRSRQDTTAASTPQPGKSFVVPLFLSRSSQQPTARGALPSTRSRTSTRSVIEDNAPTAPRPLSLTRSPSSEYSDMYDGDEVERSEPVAAAPQGTTVSSSLSEAQVSRSYHSNSSRSRHSSKHGRKKPIPKKSFRDPHVRSKARIAFAFGVTTLVALIICMSAHLVWCCDWLILIDLVLAGTGVARNTTFHVVSILLLLALTGVFLHQLIRMFMLMKRPQRATRHRRTPQSRGGRTTRRDPRTGRLYQERKKRKLEPEHVPKEPIPVRMASDTDTRFDQDIEAQTSLQYPPPIYGNQRTSIVSVVIELTR
jgi:membrane protein implicated in regulation of membrane protease activity